MKTEKALFKVVGMYCISCKPIVEKQLKNEEAVKKIDVDYMTDSVIVVEFDPSPLAKDDINKKQAEKIWIQVCESHYSSIKIISNYCSFIMFVLEYRSVLNPCQNKSLFVLFF